MARSIVATRAVARRHRRLVEAGTRASVHRAGSASEAAFATPHLRRSAALSVGPLHAETLLHQLTITALGLAEIWAAPRRTIARLAFGLRAAAVVARRLILRTLIARTTGFGAAFAIARGIEVASLRRAFGTAALRLRLIAAIAIARTATFGTAVTFARGVEVAALWRALGTAALRLRLIAAIAIARTATFGTAVTFARSVEVATLRRALGTAALRLRLIATLAITRTASLGAAFAITRGVEVTSLRRALGTAAFWLRLIAALALARTTSFGAAVTFARGITAAFRGSAGLAFSFGPALALGSRLRRRIGWCGTLRRVVRSGRSVWRNGLAVVLGEGGARAERECEEKADRCVHDFFTASRPASTRCLREGFQTR